MYSSCNKQESAGLQKELDEFYIKAFVTIQDDRQIDYATLYCDQYCEEAVKQ